MSKYWNEKVQDLNWWPVLRDTSLAFLVLVAAIMAGYPQYHVWEQGLKGQAELRRAEQNRQIKIQEATATEESARHLARAEVERAKGVSEANKIIGDSLANGGESYLRYIWLTEVAGNDTDKTVIYVPTEANIPIMEAGKRP